MRFQFVKEIGRGGMGCVYEGYDTQTGKTIAIKSMRNEFTCYPEFRDFFLSEVDALKRMNHPSVINIIDEPFQDEKGNMYLPMEFVDGKTIKEYVSEHGSFSPSDATAIMLKVLDAMKYIHSQRCIHRDIKPSNIMLRKNGEICIIDFGIAKDSAIGSTGKTVGLIIGTDGYMSPEQATGLNIDVRTDIYSLGCVFYFMLTGRDAIEKRTNSVETRVAILNEKPPLPSETAPGVSAQLDKVFLKATDKNMTLRFQTAEEFSRALKEEHFDIPSNPESTNEISTNHMLKITVGKSSDNDIVFNNPYVSGHHLIISCCAVNNNCISIEIEDNSTNGTGVNGRKIHHQKVSAKIDPNNINATTIMLAGRPECVLDLNQVVSMLTSNSNNSNSNEVDNLGCWLKGLCFLWPLLGFILYFVWKNSYPNKAKQSAKFALIGFIIGFVGGFVMIFFVAILSNI